MARMKKGWYTDPDNPALDRYWDGQDWTGQTQPRKPEKKKSIVGKVILGVVLGLVLIIGGCMAVIGTGINKVDQDLKKNGTGTVVYEVTTDGGPIASVSYSDPNGGMAQDTAPANPWNKSIDYKDLTLPLFSLTAQAGQGTGSISCKIKVGDTVKAEQTSNGEFATVSCSGSAN